mmetsp:Transcript_114719/g.180619  ORF Transcript_114719/g.180619 Transcript_114719/m.180619 type:complete len:269 (-) Transcript_114719:98-904(-)
MERVCRACGGTGNLLTEVCPLCEGFRDFAPSQQLVPMSIDEDMPTGEWEESAAIPRDFWEPTNAPSTQDSFPGFGAPPAEGGLVFLTVVVPVTVCAPLTEAEVADLGTTWAHGNCEEAQPNALRFKVGEDSTCGICLQPFDHGEKLTALPCAEHGCGSVWHLGCIHEWLNQGRSRSCPLCRAGIETGAGSGAVTQSTSTTFTIIGNSRRFGSSLSRDLMPMLLRRAVMQGVSHNGLHSDGALVDHTRNDDMDMLRWMALVDMASGEGP